MTTDTATVDDLRIPPMGVRRSPRPAEVLWGSVGRLTYGVLLWLLAFALAPMVMRWSPTVVASGSMAPVLREGDVVLVAPHDGEGLQPGAVILFQTDRSRSPVLHRIVGVTPDGSYVTKGDANGTSDSTPVRPQEVTAVARLVVPYAGLPAHWIRTRNWPGLAGFGAVMALAVWLAHREPDRGAASRAGRRRRKWVAIAAITTLLVGGIGATALAAFSGPSQNPANTLASGTWQGILDLAAGAEHSCAVVQDGTVWCWGRNADGQLGDGTTTDRPTPVPVVGPGGSGFLEGAVRVAAGSAHTCAVLRTGDAYCWGANGNGQLGDGTSVRRTIPTAVIGVGGIGWLAGVAEIDAGLVHTCALQSVGSVVCWGRNGNGQLGDGSTSDRPRPVQVVASGGGASFDMVTGIGLGALHSCAVRADRSAWCWGSNNRRQIGDGAKADRRNPAQVRGAGGTGTLTSVVQIDGGDEHTCAVLADGSAWCWGKNDHGELGDGTHTDQRHPARVVGVGGTGVLNGVDALLLGRDHSCALSSPGRVSCWGHNPHQQLGNLTMSGSPVPLEVVVSGPAPFDGTYLLAVGWDHAVAARNYDEVWGWGRNDSGQVGNGSLVDQGAAVQVAGL